MEVKLKIVGGRNDGTMIDVPGPKFMIGRADECQLRPKSETVSRRHALITLENSKLTIADLGSRTGTYVNGKLAPPKKYVELKQGDVIRIGPIEFAMQVSFGLNRQKRPKVAGVEDAAARTAQAGPADELDISQWLKPDDADVALGETMDGSPSGTVVSAQELIDAGNSKSADENPIEPPTAASAPNEAASDMLRNYLRRR